MKVKPPSIVELGLESVPFRAIGPKMGVNLFQRSFTKKLFIHLLLIPLSPFLNSE